MSHILDALRKAQDESTGTSRTSVTGSEALIARRSGSRWGGMTRRVWIMAGSGAVLLVVVGWLLYGPADKPIERQAVVQSVPPQPSVAPPAPPAAVPPVAPQPLSEPSPQPAPAAVPVPPPAAQVSASPTPKQPDESEEELGSRNRRSRRGSERGSKPVGAVSPSPSAVSADAPAVAAVPSAAQSTAPTVAGTPEGVKLTGIAWQENRKLRRAVINDVLVGEGVLVAGAKVVEIRPTAVRFEKNGSIFEVVLPR